jgi:hypothetical protein
MIPKRLSNYPWVIVNLSCKLCARRGRYRLARLAARYGPEQSLDGLLADLAHDCPYWRSNPRKYDPRCGARFEDLDRLRPQDLPPVDGAPRQRAPTREDVPQRRPKAPSGGDHPPMLSDWEWPMLVIACATCGRRETFDVKALRAATIGDVRMVDLRHSLTADCPRATAQAFGDWCGAFFEAG